MTAPSIADRMETPYHCGLALFVLLLTILSVGCAIAMRLGMLSFVVGAS